MERFTTIKLYGNIFEWSINNAQILSAQIDKAAEVSDEIRLRVHCYGGSVIEGGMIYNAIKNSRVPVDIYVDGVAASMAAILLPAARKVYMAENAFLMLHAPASCTDGRGTAEEHLKSAKALREMEKNFITALCSRTSKNETEVKKWMQGDNWFSARQALEEKLIDEIIDSVAKEVKNLSGQEVQSAKIEDVYGMYTACFDNTDKTTNKNNMDKSKLITSLGLTGVTAESTDEAIQTAIEAKLSAERTAKESAENKLKEQAKAQVTALLDSVKDKLTKEQRDQYEAIGTNMGIATLESIIAPLRSATASFTSMIANAAQGNRSAQTNRESWNMEEWQKNDPKGLEKMAREDYDSFNALYKMAFGAEAPR